MQYSTLALFLGASMNYVMACPAPSPAVGDVAEWGQCGGENWTGSTSCAAGLTCVVQNPYYYQCLSQSSTSSTNSIATPSPATSQPSSSPSPTSQTHAVTQATSTSSTASLATSSTSPTGLTSSSSQNTAAANGTTYKASFTYYGSNDDRGSGNCNVNTAACGWYTNPGFSVAASQALFGVGPGAGAGPACGTCWRIVGETDSSGNPLSNAGTSIVVMVNNLCPGDGNPLCAQQTPEDINQYGASVNFDLCSDSGAQEAFFGNDGVGLAVGTITQVDCSEWSGTVVH